MKYIYFIVLMSIAAVIALVILIISIKERLSNKKRNNGLIQDQKDLDGVSGKEIYGTWSNEKTKYKSFIRKVNKDS